MALVVLVPTADAIPERKPDLTPNGNLTIKKLNVDRSKPPWSPLMSC
ncbi:MAG TPA: hypothetical protein VFW65_02935 [Pseudonocardiaceae bacterium]|nr:hypothetical protein [Pseudonocardiaceae bacterium]